MYEVVPTCVIAKASVELSCFETPKSVSLTTPSEVSRMLAGLRSRCTCFMVSCM